MDKNRQQLIDSFVRNPTTYTISVRNGDMLPNDLKKNVEISFTIKPPTVHVLALAAAAMKPIPDKMFEEEDIDLNEALKYQEEIARVISILAHEGEDYPDWYVDFILKNVSSIELLQIMQETAVKCNPAFFLNCFQVAGQTNPMMMRIPTQDQDSTLTDS